MAFLAARVGVGAWGLCYCVFGLSCMGFSICGACYAVWAWGYGEMAALGTGKVDDEPIPVMLKLNNVLDVQCGGQHSLFLQAV